MSSNPANLWVLLGLGIAGIILVTKRLKKKAVSREDFGAFIEKLQLLPPPQPAPPKAPHPLTGVSFAVSDLFDIEGYVTGFGHPDWARSHEAASLTAAVVLALVEGGATCTGKCVIDELAYGINGESKHFGTPTNPAAPARVPGGPSSGAAVAVAANLVDFALGLDTVGGVRVPAGYCGIIGFRPSHGAVPHTGVVPVAASLDSVGWFAKDPSILRRVGHVLLNRPFGTQRNPRQIVIADDCFQLLKVPAHRVAEVVIRSSEKLFGRQVVKHEMLDRFLNSKVPSLKKFDNKKSNGECKYSSLVSLANVMRLIHRFEFKSNHEEWINLEKPILDPTVATEINEILDVSEMEIEIYKSIRTEMREAINSLLKDDGILVIPTTAYLPPKLGAKAMYSEEYLTNTFSLQSIASLSGCCQVSVPLGQHDKCPVSVSLIARHGGDRFLLDTVQNMYAALQGQVELLAESRSSGGTDSQEKSAEMAKEKGNQAFKEKQWQKAIGYYTEAIKLNGKTATYYSNRAAAYLEIGSFLQAEADCTKAIDLDKKNVKAYLRRGTAREMLGYYKEAIEDFGYALVLEPTNKRASDSVQRLRNVFQ